MIFVGIALAVAALLALVVASDAGTLIGLQQHEFAQLVALLSILVLVGGGAMSRRIRIGQFATGLALWGAIFVVIAAGYTYRTELADFGSRLLGELSPGAGIVSEDGHSVQFRRGIGGSFRVNANVNGADTHFIFDTGASTVVLTEDDAAKAGIDTSRLRYIVPVQTANGEGRAAFIRLDEIEIGGIRRERIQALVAQPGSLETSLLGMTFLETLSGYSVARDALTLTD